MVVEVSVPTSMSMLLNFPVETVVGSHLHAAVTMKASNGNAVYFRATSYLIFVSGSLLFLLICGDI